MGALTLKNFPFKLRGWDIEKFESIDPTDGFGTQTRVYISNDQIIQIEPDYNINTFNTWITDKGRQFFDSIFGVWSSKRNTEELSLNTHDWVKLIKKLVTTLYLFDHCHQQSSKHYSFKIVIDNLSIELLSLCLLIEQKYAFIDLKRSEPLIPQNDLESNFQLNLASNKLKVASSSLCLLVATNPRYEGSTLNLNLRQRLLKGNFKCLTVGSLIDLTFPITFLGSNIKNLKTIFEGNNLICQDLKFSKNPMIVFNNEIFKHSVGKNLNSIIKVLQYSNVITKSWNGVNILTPTLHETGTQSLSNIACLTNNDLNNFSSLYFLNVTSSNTNRLKKITESKLLNYSLNKNDTVNIKKLILNQSALDANNLNFVSKSHTFNQYFYLPVSMFYENEETFVNTEGFIKRTNKLIFRKKTKNNWQILRKLFKELNKINFVSQKNNQLISFNSNKLLQFKNFIYFQYQATQSLTNLNFYLTVKTKPFILNSTYNKFNSTTKKIVNTKLKYWLDDFFCGGKDEYSQNSLILTNCSKILRTESTNFFLSN